MEVSTQFDDIEERRPCPRAMKYDSFSTIVDPSPDSHKVLLEGSDVAMDDVCARPSSTIVLSMADKIEMIRILGQLLLSCGAPTHCIEKGLTLTGQKLGLDALVLAFTHESVLITGLPAATDEKGVAASSSSSFLGTAMSDSQETGSHQANCIGIGDAKALNDVDERENEHQQRHFPAMLLKSSTWPDTYRLGAIAHAINAFLRGDAMYDATMYQLRVLTRKKHTADPWTMLISFILLGFSASIIIFHGTWIDAGISSMLGAIMGSLLALAMKFPVYARVFDVSACALVSFIGRALHQHACYNASVIPAIVILLPGYNMTISVMELTERQVVSGAIRMANAIFYTFMLAYGLHLGSFLYSALDPAAPLGGTCPADTGVPSWTFIPLFPLMSVGIGLSFGAAWRQWLSQLVCAALGFCVTYFMQDFIDDGMVLNSMATLVIGLYASLTLRFFDEQPLSPLCVGITLLLPGSLGVRGAYAFLNQKDLDHASFALSMLNVALGLSVGVFASTMIVYPAGKPKSLTITL